MNKQEKFEKVTQETIGKYVAKNKDFWDTFHKGSKDSEYSVLKDLNIQTKDEFTDLINSNDLIKNVLKNLFKNILLKNEFLVGGTESGHAITNYRLIICGVNTINIPLNKVTKYGVEGNYFVVKYLRKGKERSISLEEYIDETLVNSVIDAEEFKILNEEQIYLIENSIILKKELSKPRYIMPAKPQKAINKEKEVKGKNKVNLILFKIFGTILLFVLLQFGLVQDWFLLSGGSIPDQFWPHTFAFLIVLCLALVWIVNLFKKKSIVGEKYLLFTLAIPVLTLIWPITLAVAKSKIDHSFTTSIEPGYYITLITSIVFGLFTIFHVVNRDE